MARADRTLAAPLTAGLVTGVVGFSSSFAIVLSGLTAQGASPVQAASGLFALLIAMAVGIAVLSMRYRMPIILAWSTPGAALLVGTRIGTDRDPQDWSATLGAFLVVAALTALTGLWPWLARLLAAIPTSIANGLLAGVLLPICLSAFTALARTPLLVAPIMISWLIGLLFLRRWAVPLALAVAIVIVIATTDRALTAAELWPVLSWTTPRFELAHLLGVALPLFCVNIASQYAPGVAIMKTYGYAVPWRPTMLVTAGTSALAAPFGGHAINLAAISAALAASPEADPDRESRWRAGVATAGCYVLLAVVSGAAAFVLSHSPPGLIITVAALALLGALGSALQGALADETDREAAVLTLVATASGMVLFGLGSAFWGLAIGLAVRALLRRVRRGGRR